MTKQKLAKIRKLLGAVSRDELRYVDCFASEKMCLFMPMGGACFFALTPKHSHPSYLFILHFDNSTMTRIEDKLITAQHGKLFCIAPSVKHEELASEVPPRYIAIAIEKRLFEHEFGRYPGGRTKNFNAEFFDVDAGLLPLLKRFMSEADSGLAGSEAVLDALSVEISHSIIRSILEVGAPGDRIADRIEISRVIEHLHANVGKKLTVEYLAEIARLSPSHFTRVFRDETGKAPMEYVQSLRMERAKKLLLAGDKSITDIALECGFNSTSYLSACFQRDHNMTPRNYQKQMKVRTDRALP